MDSAELARTINLLINDSKTPEWFPGLASKLLPAGREIIAPLELECYSTARAITKDKNAPSLTVDCVRTILSDEALINLNVELLPTELAINYTKSKIDFYSRDQIAAESILNCLNDAVNLLKDVPSLFSSIFSLVRSIHLIKPADEIYDVSFSQPRLPFSIFVSIPTGRVDLDKFRVAEAIIHEAMHLQLSLIERSIPLVKHDEKKFYSPWKQEARNSTGILHALYVFKIIFLFFKKLEITTSLSQKNLDYVQMRQKNISEEINQVTNISVLELTKEGFALAARLRNLTIN